MAESTSIDLALPAFPDVDDPAMFERLFQIYNAIKSVTRGLDDYTESGNLLITSKINSAILFAALQSARAEIAGLKQQLALINTNTNWGQPGVLGEVTPNDANFMSVTTTSDITGGQDVKVTRDITVGRNLTVTTAAKVGAFGANGADPITRVALPANATDLASAITLANSIKSLLIQFGLAS